LESECLWWWWCIEMGGNVIEKMERIWDGWEGARKLIYENG
jgi:hypothetical protein